MKTRFSLFGIFAVMLFAISTCFIGCQNDVNDVVTYRGEVVYINTTTPFADVTVKVTDGKNTHCQTLTDGAGLFSLKVRVNEIDGNYFLLAGDSTCIPKKVALGGYGQAEVDLGTIEVEGPALPTVVTKTIQSVTADAAIIGGEVQTDGRLSVTARGICYGTETYPTVDGLRTTDGTGIGEFTSNLKNLQHNTIYYARAYATNRMGTAYGEQVKFTTEEGVAIVVTDSIIRITAHSARCKGHVESDGGYPVTKRGTCWSKQPDPTIDDFCTNDGSGLGEFTSSMNDLIENTTYYVRTYATNSTSTTYGEQFIITTLDGLAVVKTDSISAVTATGFTAYGNVLSDCDIPVIERGFCYSTSQYPTTENSYIKVGKGLGVYQGNITNLQVSTIYYVRAYAINETGTTYGEQVLVTTMDGLPIVNTNEETTTTALIINAGGTVVDNGGFIITDRGICYSATNTTPTISDNFTSGGKGNGSFSVSIQNLVPATKYYLRAYATNENGTTYGTPISVMTKEGLPIVSTLETTATSVNITSGGNITSDRGYDITARGVCYSTQNSTPTIEDSYTTSGIGIGSFSTIITNVSVSTTYYVRAYATNIIGTGYGDVVTIITGDGLPTVITTEITKNGNAILSGGQITDDGGFPITNRGVCYGSFPNPDLSSTFSHTSDGEGIGYYTSNLGTAETLSGALYVRAFATNINGTTYGAEETVNVSYLALPTFVYNGHTYKVAPTAESTMNQSDARNYCNNLVLYEYSNWFLPDKQMLLCMYSNRNQIGGFVNSKYWSSTIIDAGSYYYVNFSTGSSADGGRSDKYYVRPVRLDH